MPNFDETENEFASGIGPVPACPPLELLRAHGQSVLPKELEERMEAHLAQCSLCQMLLSDLNSLEEPSLTRAAQDRIRARIPILVSKPPATRVRWYIISGIAAGLAMVAFLLTTGGLWKKQTLQVASSAVPQPAASPHPQMVVQVVRLAPPAGTESGLVFRGAIASDDPNSEELAMGFASYNKGDYHLAATYFAKAAKRFPSSDVPALYQGVSELLAGDNSAALESLTRADAIAKPDRKDAAAWYHAAAAARAHAPVALSLFQSLCGRDKSTYAQQACIVSASQPKSAQ